MKDIPHKDMLVYLEIARRALADGDLFDEMVDKMDISDAEMLGLRDRLEKFMEGK